MALSVASTPPNCGNGSRPDVNSRSALEPYLDAAERFSHTAGEIAAACPASNVMRAGRVSRTVEAQAFALAVTLRERGLSRRRMGQTLGAESARTAAGYPTIGHYHMAGAMERG